MNAATATPHELLKPPPSDRLGRGAVLAIGAHLLLLVALALGLQWRSHSPTPIAAELWASVPQQAAPPAPAPPPPAPEPIAVQPAPPVEPTRPAPPPPPQVQTRDADIAIEKARRERELREQREAELRRQKAEQERRDRLEREKAERDKAERERAEKAKAEKARADAEAKRLAEAKAKQAAEAEKQRQAQEAQALARQREQNLARLMSQAQSQAQSQTQSPGVVGGTGAPGSTGTAARDAGPSANYAGRIVGRIKPNIIFTDELTGNPVTEVELRTAPDGTILSRRIVRGSGVPAWDQAVLRAIDRTAVLPRDVDGRVPPSITILFKPNE